LTKVRLCFIVFVVMANRPKTERNKKILELWNDGKGWKQGSIARMFKMNEAAVQMVIHRARQKDNHKKEARDS
jgi:transcriptional regulator